MNKVKQTICLAVTFGLLVLVSVFPGKTIQSVTHSLSLCYTSVIPSLFPYFVLCRFLVEIITAFSVSAGVSAFLLGLLTGFPAGVKNVCALYENGALDRKRACALLHCTANASPAYLTAFLGVTVLQSMEAGVILLLSQTLCAVLCAFAFRCFTKAPGQRKKPAAAVILTDAASRSMTDAVASVLYVCGYVIFFGLLADVCLWTGAADAAARVMFFLPHSQARALIAGLLEISRGAALVDLRSPGSLAVCAAMVAFSGASILMQCVSCVRPAGLPVRPLLVGKLIYLLLMPLTTALIAGCVPHRAASDSVSPLLTVLLFTAFIAVLAAVSKNIFDKRLHRLYNENR